MKQLKCIGIFLCSVLMLISLFACSDSTPSNRAYWFSKYETNFVLYEETANDNAGNLDEAGNYWNMTVKKDCNITIALIINTDFYSTLEFYLNDKRILSDDINGTAYSFMFKDLSLKKGDKIKIHALWVNSIVTNEKGFEISYFCITDTTGTYIVEDIH